MASNHQSTERDTQPSVQRLLNLTDGVVAIAITLLVLDLKIPVVNSITNIHSASQLWHQLSIQQAQYISYLISFYVIALFWVIHHRILKDIVGHSSGLSVVNFFFLFTISVMPFSSNLLGRFPENPTALTIFAVNLILAEITLLAISAFAVWKHLNSSRTSPVETLRRQIVAYGVIIVLTSSIVVAWAYPRRAADVWFLIILVPFVVNRFLAKRFGDQALENQGL